MTEPWVLVAVLVPLAFIAGAALVYRLLGITDGYRRITFHGHRWVRTGYTFTNDSHGPSHLRLEYIHRKDSKR